MLAAGSLLVLVVLLLQLLLHLLLLLLPLLPLLQLMVPLLLMLLVCISLAQLIPDRMSQERPPSLTSPSARRHSPQNQNQIK